MGSAGASAGKLKKAADEIGKNPHKSAFVYLQEVAVAIWTLVLVPQGMRMQMGHLCTGRLHLTRQLCVVNGVLSAIKSTGYQGIKNSHSELC